MFKACKWAIIAALLSQSAVASDLGAQRYNEMLEKDLIYPDQEWQDYVTEIGERLLAVSPHKGQTYVFTVTDESFFNASAAPDGYIFITRGAIAQTQSEAELAGIIGHEIGHVVGRHGKRRKTLGTLGQIVAYLGSFATSSNSIYGLSNQVTNVLGASYGRQYELEADEYGAQFLLDAGYDPRGLLDSMRSMKEYENYNSSVLNLPTVYHGIGRSHPATEKRLHELIQQANHLVPEQLPETERDWWEMIDGLTFGDEAATGVVKDGIFYHGSLRVTVQFPQGWDVRASNADVFGMPPQPGNANITLKQQAPPKEVQSPEEYLTKTLRRDDLENGEAIQVGPYEGYLADIKLTANTLSARKIAVIYKDGTVYLFTGEAGAAEDPALFDTQFRDTVFSMRAMTGADLRLVNTQKIKVIYAKPGDTYAALAKQVPLKNNAEATLRLINGDHPRGEPRAGDPIKIIQ